MVCNGIVNDALNYYQTTSECPMAAGRRLKAQSSKGPPPQGLIETSFQEFLRHLPDLYTALVMDKTTLDGFTSALADGWGQTGSEWTKLPMDFKIQIEFFGSYFQNQESQSDSLKGYFKNPKTWVNSTTVALLPLTHLRISLLWSSYVQAFTSQRWHLGLIFLAVLQNCCIH